MTNEFGVSLVNRTWRPPLSYRVLLTVALAVFAAAATAFSWLTLSSNQLPGEVILVVAIPLWALFTFRLWTAAATLTQDTLIIRNVLSIERVLVADITKVAFSRDGTLRVTERRPPSSIVTHGAARHRDPGERYTVTALRAGLLASISGSRCQSDDAADSITAAAGLPALPVRRAQVSRESALLMLPAGVVLIVLGTALSDSGNPMDSEFEGLEGLGGMMLFVAVAAELGRFLARRRT